MPENTLTSIFATANTTSEEIASLLEIGLPLMADTGKVPWAKVEAATGIKYSRGWLILRRAYIEQYQPHLLVDVRSAVAAASAEAEAAGRLGDFVPDRMVLSPIVTRLHDELLCSWGEIMVRCGLAETKVRNAYKLTGGKKDRGLRIGKGGRFAYDDPTLYKDNMKVEGAHIDLDTKMRPKPEQCLNYHPKEVVAPARRAATPRKPKAAKVA